MGSPYDEAIEAAAKALAETPPLGLPFDRLDYHKQENYRNWAERAVAAFLEHWPRVQTPAYAAAQLAVIHELSPGTYVLVRVLDK